MILCRLSLFILFVCHFFTCQILEQGFVSGPPDCRKDYRYNVNSGEIEYIVFDKRCIREKLLIGSKLIECNYKQQDKGGYALNEYGCIRSTASFVKKTEATAKTTNTTTTDTTKVVESESLYLTEEQKKCKHNYADMRCVPGGYFIRGSNKHERDERPQAKIYISEFYMDTYEVTNSQYKKCLNAGACRACLETRKCRQLGPNYDWRYRGPNQPIVGVSWYGAEEYCEFMGKRLPTEAEWEKAARGPDGNIYPWGNETATCELAVIEEYGHKGCSSRVIYPPKYMPTKDVGTKPPGVYGLYDMAGNSWEWVSDWYSSSYRRCGKNCRGKDPKGPCEGKEKCRGHHMKVIRGGSWWWDDYYARGSKRRAHHPGNYPWFHHFGFRCAKSP